MTLAARVGCVVLAVSVTGCAAKSAPPLPPALAYPDFLYPVATPASPDLVIVVDRGWRFLQNNDLAAAEGEFGSALKRMPQLFAARTGLAYVEAARRDYAAALVRFSQALELSPAYVPALVGKGQTLLVLGRDEEAIAAFASALAVDRSLETLQSRIDLLRFRTLQTVITIARQARAAGRLGEARDAYRRALETAPDSAVLYRELGATERALGDTAVALDHFRRAAALDASDASAFVQIAEILEATGDVAGAETAYRQAAALEAGAGFDTRAEAMATLGREARLPEEFRAIAATPAIRRADLAALIGVRLESTLRGARRAAVVTTDTRGHWAAQWIADVVATDVMPAFDDHTFRPRATLRRVELAQAIDALLALVARGTADLEPRLAGRPAIADVAPSHLNYRAITAAVSSGVVPLLDGNRFGTERTVSGAEAMAAIDRLRALDQVR